MIIFGWYLRDTVLRQQNSYRATWQHIFHGSPHNPWIIWLQDDVNKTITLQQNIKFEIGEAAIQILQKQKDRATQIISMICFINWVTDDIILILKFQIRLVDKI